MKILCISASNTKLMGPESASTKVCELIKNIIHKDYTDDIEVKVLPLMDYPVIPCNLCGECSKDMNCKFDESFNAVFSELSKADAIFLVVPHYSPIPSKLIILFEKINEITVAGYQNDRNFKSPLAHKTVGLIGHGGIPESDKVLDYYHEHLVTPIAETLKLLSFNVVGVNDHFTNGAVFGLKDKNSFYKVENAIFPGISHDWTIIENRIKPLIENVISSKQAAK